MAEEFTMATYNNITSKAMELASPSSATNISMQSNAENKFGFLEKHKRLLIGLWQNLVGIIRMVEDRCLHHFRGDQIERIRFYHVWPGNNVFFLRGLIICGPDPRRLLLTILAICLSSWTFVAHVASDSPNRPSIIICTLFLTTIVLVNLGMVSMIDPGIIPRNDGSSSDASDYSDKTRGKRVTINGIEIKLKYCRICNIIRPPRSCHCAVCDNCIEKFDHHCPWLGQCIGRRNYRLYMMLLVTGLALFVYIFVLSCQSIRNRMIGGGIGLLRDWPETLVLAIFTFAAAWFLCCLACYHAYLLAINQTAYENFRQQYVSSENPYDRGVLKNIKEVLLSPWPPSRVNFRAEVRTREQAHQESHTSA